MEKRRSPDVGRKNPEPRKKARIDSPLHGQELGSEIQEKIDESPSVTEERSNGESFSTPPTLLNPSVSATEATEAGTARPFRYPSDQKLFACHFPGCDRRYNRPTRLNAHLRSHTNDRPFKCAFDDCDKSYREKKHLDFHVQGSHSKPDRLHVCPVADCDKSFQTATRLRRHQLVHEGKERFRCRDYPPCAESFRKHQTLQRHVRTAHLHLAAFPCREAGCAAEFPSAAQLRRHAEREHGEAKFWCDECGDEGGSASGRVGFTTLELLQGHIRSEHVACMFCDVRPRGPKALADHIDVHHSATPVEQRKTVACTWAGCQKKFTKKSNLRVHVRAVHEGVRFICGEVDVSGAEGLAAWPREGGCGHGFVTKASLEHHVRVVHLGLQRPRAPPAVDRADILGELSGLADEAKRNISCTAEGCSYKFIRYHDLQTHLNNYHGQAQEDTYDDVDVNIMRLAEPDFLSGPVAPSAPSDGLFGELPASAAYPDEFWVGARDDFGLTQQEDEWAQDEQEMRSLIEELIDPALHDILK